MTDAKSATRIAFVTGASRGIGAAIAYALARRRIGVVLAVRNLASTTVMASRIAELGVPCSAVECDVSNIGDVRRAVSACIARYGRLDIVVNNAGKIDAIARIADTATDTWQSTIEVNLNGAYFVTRESLPYLEAAGGAIVNLSSGAADVPREGWSAYCSSKAALAMFSRCTDLEYSAKGVSVYSVQPGMVDTDMHEIVRASGINEVSRIARSKLAPADLSAGFIAWLADTRPDDLKGMELSANDVALRTRASVGHVLNTTH